MIENKKTKQERLNHYLGEIHHGLIDYLVVSKKISIEEYNQNIAPLLSEMGKKIDGIEYTPRTFRLHPSIFEEK